VFTARVELSDKSIEVRNLFSRRSLLLDSIRGFRERTVIGKTRTTYLKIEPINETMPILEFGEYFNFDSAFYEWCYSLPDLDEVEERK
jgi:hypothetical protein